MENQKKVLKLFLIGLACSLVAVFPGILDLTLVSRFIALSITLLIFLFLLNKLKLNLSIRIDIILLSYLAFLVFSICSVAWAQNPAEAIFSSAKQVLGFLVFVISYFCLKTNKKYFEHTFFKISVVISFIALSIGAFQFLGIKELNKESLYSVSGINGHKNLFTSFLFLNLFFIIKAAMEFKRGWKIAAVIALILSLLFIVLLGTKAVWVGSAVLLFVFSVFYFVRLKSDLKKPFPTLDLIIVFLFVSNIFFLKVLEPLLTKSVSENQPSFFQKKILGLDEERLRVWAKTYHLINNHQMLGVGNGNWQIHFPDATSSGLWRVEDFNFTFQRPHNDFLWILSETGIVGFNLFILLLSLFVVFIFKCLTNFSGDKREKIALLLPLGFIISFFTVALFDFPKERIEHSILINIVFAFGYYQIQNAGAVKRIISLPYNKLVYALSFVILLFICYVGLLRYKGEYYTIKLYDSRKNNNGSEILKNGKLALSFAYNIDPTSVPIDWYIGNAYAANRDYKAAETAFTTAFKNTPYNRNVVNDLASVYAMLDKKELAKKYYAEAARISPRFDDPKLNLVAIYITENNIKLAKFWLNSILHNSQRRNNYEKIIELAEAQQIQSEK